MSFVPAERFAQCDPIWSALRAQAEQLTATEPSLASLAHATILKHEEFEDALSYHLAKKVGGEDLSPMLTREIFEEAGLDATDPYDVMRGSDENFHQPADIGRAGLPEEVASLTAYLASRTNGYVTGADVNVDGGSDFV